MAIPATKTDRLMVREFIDGEQAARQALIIEAFGHPLSDVDNAAWFAWTLLNYRALERLYQPPYGEYAVLNKQSGHLVGSVGLVPSLIPWAVLDDYRRPGETAHPLTSPEFGLFWAISADQRGKGYAVEAVRVIIDFMFQTLKVRQMVATTEHNNRASQQVMQKLGMTVLHNPGDTPFWFEVAGILNNPSHPIG